MAFEGEPETFIDPKSAAVDAGLRYIADDSPGISRRRQGSRFVYLSPNRKQIRDKETLARIRALAIPPAWTEVWISADPNGHLAATGRDSRGRKQYRYNPDFVRVRNDAKFEHVVAFARDLPRLRARIAKDMARTGLPREKVLATIVHLLETTRARVGNQAYAKRNGTYGLTTLRSNHVKVRGDELKFQFKGKSGKIWQFGVTSRRVAKIIRACQDLPGQHLFEYRDAEGCVHAVGSSDVNAYLRDITGRHVTAKDFRTWTGTVQTALALRSLVEAGRSPSKRVLREAIAHSAKLLGNTVAVCRKCYVHPAIIAAFELGRFSLAIKPIAQKSQGLRAEERAVLRLLKRSADVPDCRFEGTKLPRAA